MKVPPKSKATTPNPKDAVASLKLSQIFFPPVATLHGNQFAGSGLQSPDNQDMFFIGPLTSALR